MRWVYCTRAALVPVFVAALAVIQPPAADAQQQASNLMIFLGGVLVGNEQSAVTRSAEGWTITASGRIGAPFNFVTRRLQVRYDANWKANGAPMRPEAVI